MSNGTVDRVARLLERCGQPGAILPPTALFNEGWMLRLVLDWAARHPLALSELRFEEGSTWYSEALLASRFRPRRRGDIGGEGFTHADGVIGHFRLRPGGRGDVELLPNARQFLVIEAKMASGLSAGTRRAPDFNQAARNVACIAHLLCGVGTHDDPDTVTDFGFVVLAPARRIAEGAFQAVEREAIRLTVAKRSAEFDSAASSWCDTSFTPILNRCRLNVAAWETILERIGVIDPSEGQLLAEFYSQCLKYNPLESPLDVRRV